PHRPEPVACNVVDARPGPRDTLRFARFRGCITRADIFGEVSERFKEHAWKACMWVFPASRVRIPPSPPFSAPTTAVDTVPAAGSKLQRFSPNPKPGQFG